jgi:aerobic carbon-monoxide dehydrogenase small subunit
MIGTLNITTTDAEAVPVSITVNGRVHQATVPAHRLLVEFLREDLGLTGTKAGCETGQCGACTILLDGVSVKGCTVLAAQADGAAVTTIEGLATNGALTRVQTALWEEHGVQCGYCTPAMVLAMTDLLNTNPKPSEHEIRKSMDGIICRCGVYQNVVRAVQTLI